MPAILADLSLFVGVTALITGLVLMGASLLV
jgi:hypothetical protein